MQMVQQAKQNQMQRDPSGMDGRDRPSSPASGENAPSPSKRQRLEGGPFNPNQPGAMMPNGRPGQGMPGQQMPGGPNVAAAQQMLTANGINPNTLHPQQLQTFVNAPPAAQQKSIATYSQNLQQHHGTQMGGNKMPNAPQGQGSPMMAQGPDGTALNAFYNPGEMGGPGGMRPGPNGPQTAGGSNHALQDYQMQLMLLEQQNKKRLMMARQEQDTIGNGMPREGGPGQPGGPPGPNGQFPDTSPQAMRAGASPNPAEQMKRGTPQMNNSGIPSPVPEGGQSRGSPNPAMNFMNNHVEPGMAPHFFKGMEGNMAGQPPMNGNMRPPSSHPGQPFNGQMTPQMMAQARQQQAQQGQPGQGPQWQQGPNGQMVPQQMQQASPQIQGTPQQRSMPPPQAPPANNANNRTTASPQQPAAAPPTPSQTNKAAPKKKESKAAKDKVIHSKSMLVIYTDKSCSVLLLRRSRIPTSTMRVLLPLATTMTNKRRPPPQLPSTPTPTSRTDRLDRTTSLPQHLPLLLPRLQPVLLQLRQWLLRATTLTKTWPWITPLAAWYVQFCD